MRGVWQRTRLMGFWGFTLLAAVAGPNPAFAEESVPRLKPPRFPLEPGRKAPKPAAPETYVEGPEAPPSEINTVVRAEETRVQTRWRTNLQLGWIYSSQVSHHEFSTPSGGLIPVRRDSGTPLSLGGLLSLRPPSSPVSFGVRASGSFGSAEAVASSGGLSNVQFNTQEFQAALGPSLHLLKPGIWDLRLSAEGAFRLATYATLTPSLTAIDSDNRSILSVVPGLGLGYEPHPNWGAQAFAGYGVGLSASGSSGVTGTDYRRLQVEVEAYRYIAAQSALGLGFVYENEKVNWTQSAPVVLADSVSSSGTRLSLFWKNDL